MSRRNPIFLVAGLAICAILAFVVLPRPRAHTQAKPAIAYINVNALL